MKMRWALVSAIVTTMLTSVPLVRTQTYSAPRNLPLERAIQREFRTWLRRPNGDDGLIPARLYPIGWSRDGKFAYYYEPADEECGCYFARLVIQDMRTDKVLYEFKYNQDDDTDPKSGELRGPGNLRSLWRRNQKRFSQKLRDNRIVSRISVLFGKTFTADGRSYTVNADKKIGRDPDYDQDRVNGLTFTLTSPKLGTKTLATFDRSKEKDWYMLDAGVLGVIRSPFEPRVAIVGMEINRGWEGPPHVGDIRIIGGSLNQVRTTEPTSPNYPAVWFTPITDPNKPSWEILPQEARAGEVILSKRNELGILSNFAATPFELDGKRYASVEGFWQMMHYPEGLEDERGRDKRVTWKFTREQVAQMTAFDAKSAGTLADANERTLGIDWVSYNGKRFPYKSATPGEHYKLILAAMRAKLDQNPEVKRILLATGDLKLRPDHVQEPDAPPEWRYYEIWMQLRTELQKPAR